jgi:tRNA(Arg) A34 adenosine deaminase TadA
MSRRPCHASRQFPAFGHNRKNFNIVTVDPFLGKARNTLTQQEKRYCHAVLIARQRAGKHIPAEANVRKNRTSIVRQRPKYEGKNRITSVAMQHAVNITIEEEVCSMWFAYSHC